MQEDGLLTTPQRPGGLEGQDDQKSRVRSLGDPVDTTKTFLSLASESLAEEEQVREAGACTRFLLKSNSCCPSFLPSQ